MRHFKQLSLLLIVLLGVTAFQLRAEEPDKPTPAAAAPIGESGMFKLIEPDSIEVGLDDIVGIGEIKEDINEIIDIISNPKKYQEIGGSTVKGVLLYGPPGTGKTMLSKAIAKRAKMPFISVDPTAFQGMYVSDSQQTAKMLFKVARQLKPCIIFIDEIELVIPTRTSSTSEQLAPLIAQFLIEMDGINAKKNEGITILGTTNKINQIDSAFLRPGRFDAKVYVRLPNTSERKSILDLYIKKIPFKGTADTDKVAKATPGFSGADLNSIIVKASNHAAYKNRKQVIMSDIDFALKKVLGELKERKEAYKSDTDSLDFEMIHSEDIDISFDNIAGYNEVKAEVSQIIDFMRNPTKYEKLGAVSPKGIMLHGPPGTGKTMLARAIAGEGEATFISVSGSDFNQRYVGVGAQRVRELFEVARQFPPAIIFIDEIDAVAASRNEGGMGQSDMQTVNQLLTEMDNISSDKNSTVIVVGATNLLKNIDPALLRPGRFDRKVKVRLPNANERMAILELYLKNVPASSKINKKKIIDMTAHFSGAAMKNLVNEAAIQAANSNHKEVMMEDFDFARNKIQFGLMISESVQSEDELLMTAYHEVGHALVSILLPDWKYHFYTIEVGDRDHSLGLTTFNLQGEESNWSYAKYRDFIAISFGGRLAEELVYGPGNVTEGISSDMEKATNIAAHLVNNLGLSPSPVAYSAMNAGNSKEAQAEIKRIVEEEYARAKKALSENRHLLEVLTQHLHKKKSLSYEEALDIIKRNKTQKAAANDQ